MPKARVWSAEKSHHSCAPTPLRSKAQNIAWSAAKKAPLFLKKPKYVGSGAQDARHYDAIRQEVPVPQRSNRCIRSSTMKVLLSGAAAGAAAVLGAEAEALKTEVMGEANVAAALPKLSAGARSPLSMPLSRTLRQSVTAPCASRTRWECTRRSASDA